jgi:predicted enzyme related to lactoylglutathione lyase
MAAEHGTFYWNELMTRDVERAKKFYAQTIGWTFEAMPTPDGSTYWLANMDGEPVAGIFDISGPEYGQVLESWMAYLAVDDVDARVYVRCSGRRPYRYPDGTRRCRHRLDDTRAVMRRSPG